MATVLHRMLFWIFAVLMGSAAYAQVTSMPHVPPALPPGDTSIVIPAADGTQITAIVDGNSRIISASGRTKAGTFLAVQISYQTAGLTYTFNGPVVGLFSITVIQGQMAVAVQASTSARATLVLIYQTPYPQLLNPDKEFQTYTTPAVGTPKSGPIPGPMQVFPYVGNELKGVFPEYEEAAMYFAPAFDLIANSTPPWPSGSGYTIATKLESDQSAPRKVCSIPDAAGSAYGLLVCIGVGIDSGTLSSYPDNLLAKDGLIPVIEGGGGSHGGLPCVLGSGPKGMPNGSDCASPPDK